MKKRTSSVLAGTIAAALAAAVVQQPANAATSGGSPSQADPGASAAHRRDDRPGPLTHEQQQLRQLALQKLDDGTATKRANAGGGSTVNVGKGKNVELFDNNKQARILSILSQFGGTGPAHNQIPQPDRTKDNSTIWASDFNQAHYDQMFNGSGESFKSFYKTTSGGRYTPEGTVENWVTVPHEAAYYGANPHEDQGGAWDFINDTGDAWFTQKLASLGTKAAVDQYLSQFDKWDRYDYDGDGNFNEPDGYIDHFQAIHAGEGEEAGASPDAIWSHRWYAYGTDFGKTGPTVNGTPNLMGGVQIGDSGYYIGDYTVEPENGGLGVFAHEYGHDLGLPDFYDTTNTAENDTAFWTLMSSGSWLNHGGTDGIGTTPGGMGPDERRQLGWLDYATVKPGHKGVYKIGSAGAATPPKGTVQAVKVDLPDKTTTTEYTTPPEGTHAWWSGRANNLNNTLTRSVPAASKVTVSAATWYDTEPSYDYFYGEYSTDNGATWKPAGDPLTGKAGWSTLTWSYDAGNAPSLFRFRYQTDGGVNESGVFLDSITVAADGTTVATDGAEAGNNGWTPKGWTVSTGTDSVTTPRYYLLENRTYTGYDKTLQEGPYNFSEAVTRPDWVERFPFQDGMLVWYADKAYADNNVSAHPGSGQALPVDARPAPMMYPDGTKPSNRRQPFDATFGLQKTDAVCLHKQVKSSDGSARTLAACAPSVPGIATFDDSTEDAYYSPANPYGSTKVAGLGVKATVTSQGADQLTVSVVDPGV